MTQILIVDDQDDMRAGLRAMLLLDPGLVVVGDLSDGLQVVPLPRDHPVGLVLMDIRMPGIDGVEPPAGFARSTRRRSCGCGGGALSAAATATLVGHMNDEIAAQMSVSPLTVKTHAVRAMTKVGARDRAQLVSFIFRAGLYP